METTQDTITHEIVRGLTCIEQGGQLIMQASEEFRENLKSLFEEFPEMRPEEIGSNIIADHLAGSEAIYYAFDINHVRGVGGLTEAPAIVIGGLWLEVNDDLQYACSLTPTARVYYDPDYHVRDWVESLAKGYDVRFALAVDCRDETTANIQPFDGGPSPLEDAEFVFFELRTDWHGAEMDVQDCPAYVYRNPVADSMAVAHANGAHEQGAVFATVHKRSGFLELNDCSIDHVRMLLASPPKANSPIGIIAYHEPDNDAAHADLMDHVRNKIADYSAWVQDEVYQVTCGDDSDTVYSWGNALDVQQYHCKNKDAIPTYGI